MKNASATVFALGALALGSCCPAKPVLPEEPGLSGSVASTASVNVATVGPPGKAKVVVVFVIDQLGSWVLDKYLPHLPKDGVLRRGAETGVYADVAYAYASNRTAPGHAAIVTGHPPAVTGVTSNRVILPGGGHRSFVSDGKHRVLGRNEPAFASPTALRVPTVGDALHEATGGAAKIITLSGKDRAAVISGGQRADLAVWYDYKIPAFTTSTYYADTMPASIASWSSAHPIADLLVPWTAAQPKLYAELLGPDDGAGEGDWLGFGTTFPHDANATNNPYSVLRLMPQLTERLMDLAGVVADANDVGKDDVVDLMVVSVSGTDYVGHSLGAMSWELADHLIRADRAMGKLVRHLEKRGPVAVLITADHGVSPLPEKSQNPASTRLFPDAITKVAQAAVDSALGEGEWVKNFSAPFLYLRPGLTGAQHDSAVAAILPALEAISGIHGAYDVKHAKTWRSDPDRVKRSVGLSIADDTLGAIYVLPAAGCIMDEHRPRGKGTTHGTPWPHDAHVPAIFWGPGIAPRRITEVLPQNRVAPTISKLLGIAPPKGISAAPLPGAK